MSPPRLRVRGRLCRRWPFPAEPSTVVPIPTLPTSCRARRERQPRRRVVEQRGQMEPLALDNPTLYQPRLFELAAPPDGSTTTCGNDRTTRLLARQPPDPGDGHARQRPIGGRQHIAGLFGRRGARRRTGSGDRPRRRRPQRRRLSHRVVVRCANAADVEPQLRRGCAGRPTPS
jgi:hypothetical protein